MQEWFLEKKSPTALTGLAVERVLYEGRTRWQSVRLLENSAVGPYLVLDGQLQSASSDEHVYHEALVHPALLTHHSPRRVLILGGGEGATLREVLRHPSVERAVMVELDEELVDLCRRYLPHYSQGAFDSPRAELVVTEARAWLDSCREHFDVILSDLTEPGEDGLSHPLFGIDFFNLVRSRLGPGGVFALQASGGYPDSQHPLVARTVARAFPVCRSLVAYIDSFQCPWAFLVASRGPDPLALEVDRALRQRRVKGLRFYDGQTHRRLFSLPPALRPGGEFLGRCVNG